MEDDLGLTSAADRGVNGYKYASRQGESGSQWAEKKVMMRCGGGIRPGLGFY